MARSKIKIKNVIEDLHDARISDEDIANWNQGGGGGTPYTLPIASTTILGGIKVGNNLEIEEDGTLNSLGEELPSNVMYYSDSQNVPTTTQNKWLKDEDDNIIAPKSNAESIYLDDGKTIKEVIVLTAEDSEVVGLPTCEDLPFRFGIDENGNYGYYKVGADTVTPFSSGGSGGLFYGKFDVGFKVLPYTKL